MYGEGFMARRARYIWNGCADVLRDMRWATTVWITSPAIMYSRVFSTMSS